MSELPVSIVTSDISTNVNNNSESKANQLVASLLRKHALYNERTSNATSTSLLLSSEHSPVQELGKELESSRQQIVNCKTNIANASSLRTLTDQVASFLSLAPNTPPVMMESTTLNSSEPEEENTNASNKEQNNCSEEQRHHRSSNNSNNRNTHTPESECYVELNVVAGVLQNKSDTWRNNANCKDGILLPTEQTINAFEESKAHEAKAMLSLLDALTPNSYFHDDCKTHYNSCTTNKKSVLAKHNENCNSESVNCDIVESCDDGTSDSDSSVVIMDADELDSDDSSDRDDANNKIKHNNYNDNDNGEQCKKRCKTDRDEQSASHSQHHKIV